MCAALQAMQNDKRGKTVNDKLFKYQTDTNVKVSSCGPDVVGRVDTDSKMSLENCVDHMTEGLFEGPAQVEEVLVLIAHRLKEAVDVEGD